MFMSLCCEINELKEEVGLLCGIVIVRDHLSVFKAEKKFYVPLLMYEERGEISLFVVCHFQMDRQMNGCKCLFG